MALKVTGLLAFLGNESTGSLHWKGTQRDSRILKSASSCQEGLKQSRSQRRVYELLSKAATTSQHHHPIVGQRELHFLFFRKPDRFLPSNDVAVSMDYRGIVPNTKGRVLSSTLPENGVVEAGLYVAGWLKRGPTGIIATNLYCAEETIASIIEDIGKGSIKPVSGLPKHGRQGHLELLDQKNVKFVSLSVWEKIDSKERIEGHQRNKPREKIASWKELLMVANK